MTCGDPELATDFQASPAKAINPGSLFLGSQSKIAVGN